MIDLNAPEVAPKKKKHAMDRYLAFDRSTVRNYDADGRLHIATTNISKANVCPYVGNEIPDYDRLGLDPKKTYMLYRDPLELEKAVPSFNNLPVLSKHVAVSADDHQPSLVIGSTGTDAEFIPPYMRNSMVVWAQPAIDDIDEADRGGEGQKEISCAYRYRADMTPGVANGVPYDGVMRDIIGNHVAIVKEGRAGPDVVVGDSKPPQLQEFLDMTHKNVVLSRKAAMAEGALLVFLRPKMAADAKIDLKAALKNTTAKNFVEQIPSIVSSITTQLTGKLAKDANLNDIHSFLDSVKDVPEHEPEKADAAPAMTPNGAAVPGSTMKPEPDVDADDAKPWAKGKAFLTGKLSQDDMDALDAIMCPKAADADPEDDDDDDDDDGEKVNKAAMDSAIAKAKTDMLAEQRAVRVAEREVRPYVGELAMAHDSAADVYKVALTSLGVDLTGVPKEGYRALLKAYPVPGRATRSTVVAADAAASDNFASRYPNAARIATL
jgi:hypothetical protein